MVVIFALDHLYEITGDGLLMSLQSRLACSPVLIIMIWFFLTENCFRHAHYCHGLRISIAYGQYA